MASAQAPLELAAPEESDPLIDWHRGDTPMTQNWMKKIGIEALLAAALTAAPALAAPDDPPKDKDGLKEVKETLARIEGKLNTLDKIKLDIVNLQTELKLIRESTSGDIQDMKLRMEALEAKLKGLEGQLKEMTTARKAFSPPAPATGKVRLHNRFTQPARVIVNDRSYPLEPNQSADLSNLPIGALTYEVIVRDEFNNWSIIQPRTTVNLTAERPRVIEIYTR
jgi:hypothetical protein